MDHDHPQSFVKLLIRDNSQQEPENGMNISLNPPNWEYHRQYDQQYLYQFLLTTTKRPTTKPQCLLNLKFYLQVKAPSPYYPPQLNRMPSSTPRPQPVIIQQTMSMAKEGQTSSSSNFDSSLN